MSFQIQIVISGTGVGGRITFRLDTLSYSYLDNNLLVSYMYTNAMHSELITSDYIMCSSDDEHSWKIPLQFLEIFLCLADTHADNL